MNGPLVHLKFRFEFKSSEVCLLVETCPLLYRAKQLECSSLLVTIIHTDVMSFLKKVPL